MVPAFLNCTKPGPPLLRVGYFMAVPKIFMVKFFVFRGVGKIVKVCFCDADVFPSVFRRVRFAASAHRSKVRLCRDFSNIDFVYNGCNYFTVGADVTRTRSSPRSSVATVHRSRRRPTSLNLFVPISNCFTRPWTRISESDAYLIPYGLL